MARFCSRCFLMAGVVTFVGIIALLIAGDAVAFDLLSESNAEKEITGIIGRVLNMVVDFFHDLLCVVKEVFWDDPGCSRKL